MKNRFLVPGAGLLMAIAIVVLGFRVWQLERAVGSLTQSIQQPPRVLYVPATSGAENDRPEEHNVFRLLDSGNTGDAHSTAFDVR